MTSRQRWLAAVKFQPVDRLPFWPKLNRSYAMSQEGRFRTMTADEIHDWVGSDKPVQIVPRCVREVRTHSSLETTRDNGDERTVYSTKNGSMQMIKRWDLVSQSPHPVVFPVKTREDIELMTEWFDDCRIEVDLENVARAQKIYSEIDGQFITQTSMGKSPLMNFVEFLAGIENAQYHLADYPDEVEALFEAMQRVLLRTAEIYAEHCPADLLYFTENTSTTLISPRQYRKYCYKHIQQYAGALESHDRVFVLHMCGFLKDILPDLAQLGAQVFEAFTSPPVGNTTFAVGREGCPDKCLVGGTNATTWLKTGDDIIAEIQQGLEALPHQKGIVVSSAGVMPPLCAPETIRQVCDWLKQFNPN